MIDEIGTKMSMMQQERDKYEDLIEDELSENKGLRIECVTLNMRITQLETQLMALNAKREDAIIQSKTLHKELKLKMADTDSAEIKEMKSVVFNFQCEKEDIEKQVKASRERLMTIEKDLVAAASKTSQLNIELGELKLMLESIQNIGSGGDGGGSERAGGGGQPY